MKYAIVYSSRTGNTKQLAEAVRDTLPAKDCVYFGPPHPAALAAQRLYVGFWTDKGDCDAQTASFLKELSTQEIYLFGTAGFGESQAYFDRILEHTGKHIGKEAHVIGGFMCQGKMPPAVRARYESMRKDAGDDSKIESMIKNFDRALSHPNFTDLEALKSALRSLQ